MRRGAVPGGFESDHPSIRGEPNDVPCAQYLSHSRPYRRGEAAGNRGRPASTVQHALVQHQGAVSSFALHRDYEIFYRSWNVTVFVRWLALHVLGFALCFFSAHLTTISPRTVALSRRCWVRRRSRTWAVTPLWLLCRTLATSSTRPSCKARPPRCG